MNLNKRHAAAKQKMVLASANKGKLKELAKALEHLPYEIHPQNDFGVDCVPETGTTFAENALLKARHAYQKTGYFSVADDSGLIVDALGGAPGIYSARYAGEAASAQENVEKLLAELAAQPNTNKAARFFCAIACVIPKFPDHPIQVHGTWEGRISTQPKGTNGFGYDPIFFVPEKGCVAAELTLEVKMAISHRGQALSRLVHELRSRG